MENTHHNQMFGDNWQTQNEAGEWQDNPATGEDTADDSPEPITENTPQTQNYASASDDFQEDREEGDDEEGDNDSEEDDDGRDEGSNSDWGMVDPLEHPGPPSDMDPSAPGSAV
jgi:hypothetical protein